MTQYFIEHPEPMPVEVPEYEELEPFFDWICNLQENPEKDVQFKRGALLKGGHLDMCKQVVGPAHLYKLCEAVKKAGAKGFIEHYLMGNNIAFEFPENLNGKGAANATDGTRVEGINAMLEVMKPEYGIKTWYLAGNCINYEILDKMCSVLSDNDVCESLWLKRNPLGKQSDLHNTGIGDEGLIIMEKELSENPPYSTKLKHLYLGANGIGLVGAKALKSILKHFKETLETFMIDINRLGDEGIQELSSILKECKNLKRLVVSSNGFTDKGMEIIENLAFELPLLYLSVGFYKSTEVLGESYNKISNVSPIINIIENHPTIQLLNAEKCGLSKEETHRMIEASKRKGGVSLYALQQIGFHIENVIAHDSNQLKIFRNDPIVDHIFSIYRNKM
ncbi:hypothetical protein O9G_003595 [Rozella allomycis CSF55]|uniref:RNI-like protein n=1 Tax=Rozella allomycis (strain CSF55) TaxID=988480 RepID=A0A075APA6_ROZAC|nr:hypothetical protein O9G_003595 [Rozella allomycis CSF55]|eukprot:EPZ31886.1 hypothetical protein O9G_003595 [Rozella allomycis CSF55]